MKTSDFDYELPPELIAQEPLRERTASRMLVVHRASGRLEHRHSADLPEYLSAGDCLVLNDTKVIPARIYGQRSDTGGKVELLLVEQCPLPPRSVSQGGVLNEEVWECLVKAGWKAREGLRMDLADGQLRGKILKIGDYGKVTIQMSSLRPVLDVLEDAGVPPLPPYIKRGGKFEMGGWGEDRDRYQTVYARTPGAVAAPTAGLHFTDELLSELKANGVDRSRVTLHVGPGTFKPVKSDRVEDHHMEAERYCVGDAAVEAVNRTRASGGRIVAVGSTVVRTVETVAADDGEISAEEGRSSLYIYPPYRFKAVDVMLTNFHLPKSTLLMMVCAFGGQEQIMNAYHDAIAQQYRFYSYGDCMLIL